MRETNFILFYKINQFNFSFLSQFFCLNQQYLKINKIF